MADSNYIYLNNPFLIATVKNYEKTYTIGEFHMNALIENAGNPNIVIIKNPYTPFWDDYKNKFNNWHGTADAKKSKTGVLKNLFKEATAKLDYWDRKIQDTYTKGSEVYNLFFPNGRKPFTKGKVDIKIAAYKTLFEAMEPYPLVNVYKLEVIAFHTQLAEARSQQEGKISGTATTSAQLEASRVALCIQMNAGFGYLKWLYPNEPDMVASYIDVENLRTKAQTTYRKTINSMEVGYYFKKTFAVGKKLLITVTDTDALQFYFTASAENVPPQPGDIVFTVNSAQAQEINPSQAGYTTERTYLHVFNPSPNTGKGVVKLV